MYIENRCKRCGEKFVRAYDTDFCSMDCAKIYVFRLDDDPKRLERMWASGVNRTPMRAMSDGVTF
jgi:hypothetical protein